eukprot:241050-Prymnesium_polylepis.1
MQRIVGHPGHLSKIGSRIEAITPPVRQPFMAPLGARHPPVVASSCAPRGGRRHVAQEEVTWAAVVTWAAAVTSSCRAPSSSQ